MRAPGALVVNEHEVATILGRALDSPAAAGHGLHEASAHATRVAAYSVTRLGAQPSYPGPADPLP